MQKKLTELKRLIGVGLYDYLPHLYKLYSSAESHLTIINRKERLGVGPTNTGYVCLWPYTSRLHAPQVIPDLGRRLYNVSLNSSNFVFKGTKSITNDNEVSVIIGHKGHERLPHLLTTLGFIAGQQDVSLECIVVEQDEQPRIRDKLPSWVRYSFNLNRDTQNRYNRSAAFNHGAKIARSKILLLHDNDMIIPSNYCREIKRIISLGYRVANIKRYVFYLNQKDSAHTFENHQLFHGCVPEYIVQNLEAGGSIAIESSAFREIGGMDEEFVGWGGEDNEFWARCSSLNKWIWGYLPIIHLWHNSQPLKEVKMNYNVQRSKDLLNIDVQDRIIYLRNANRFNEKDE